MSVHLGKAVMGNQRVGGRKWQEMRPIPWEAGERRSRTQVWKAPLRHVYFILRAKGSIVSN